MIDDATTGPPSATAITIQRPNASKTAPSIMPTSFENILRATSSWSTTDASLQKTTTQSPLCREKKITVMMSSDEDKVLVEITPDVKTELPVGSHAINIRGCVYRIEVMKKRS